MTSARLALGGSTAAAVVAVDQLTKTLLILSGFSPRAPAKAGTGS